MMCVVSPAPDDADIDDVAAADAVDDAVDDRVSEAEIDCEDADDCAAAKPTRADTMKAFEKCMLMGMGLMRFDLMNY
jgi:hypothetical protein